MLKFNIVFQVTDHWGHEEPLQEVQLSCGVHQWCFAVPAGEGGGGGGLGGGGWDYSDGMHLHPYPADRRRKSFERRIMKFRDEVDRVFDKVRSAGHSIRGGMENIRARLSPSRELEGYDHGQRRVRIEYDHNTKRKSKSRDTCYDLDDCEGYDLPDHNYSPALVIHPLMDGKFIADISLDKFPPEDDIIVRVRNYKLDIFLQHKVARKDTRTVSKPFRVGDIDLPIYVDPTTLQFTLDDDDAVLTIVGRCKGFLSRRLSISSDDIAVKDHYVKNSKTAPSPSKKAMSRRATKWYLDSSKVKEKQENTHQPAFRTRSNTQ